MSIHDPFARAAPDWTLKGLDVAAEGLGMDAFIGRNLSLFDDQIMLPTAILKRSVIRSNSAWMRRFLALTGAKIAPHGKTTMAPELFRVQIDDGAWAMTAATVHHVRAYRRFGVERIFMANQLIGAGSIRWIAEELERDASFDFYCLVDSVAGIEAIASAMSGRQGKRPINVLIEVGHPGGRAGVRTLDDGLRVARAVGSAGAWVRLAGIETFEGIFLMSEDGQARAQRMLDLTVALARACDAEGLFTNQILLTAGGSAFFDLAARTLAGPALSVPVDIVIRPGCYLVHDNGMCQSMFEQLQARSPHARSLKFDLRPALEVWAHVQSKPEPGWMICSLGRRDVGNDAHQPQLVAWTRPGDRSPRPAPAGYRVAGLNDQHCYMQGPADTPLGVGDLVGFGVSHPCTTFDKWRALLVVDDDYRVQGLARTYF